MKSAARHECRSVLLVLVSCAALLPGLAAAAVSPLFDLRTPTTAPFPSNRFTVPESRNLTALRINLPKPDCAKRPSECQDVDVLNTLDGFNLQPRLRIPFSGPINLSTVNSSNIFLVQLADPDRSECRVVRSIGINQSVWDPLTNTLYAESDELLEQHAAYALIVTTGIRDASGAALVSGDFSNFLNDPATYPYADSNTTSYRTALLDAIQKSGIARTRILAASVFTTQSVTSDLEKIRNQIKARTPEPASFTLGPAGLRTVFPVSNIADISVARQITTAPTFDIQPAPPVALLNTVPNSVGSIAFGRYSTLDYLTPQQYIAPIPTRSGVPIAERLNTVYFNLLLPSGAKPAAGWPVAIYGSGFGSNKETILAFASVLASQGIATLGINVVGHGGGVLGTLTVNNKSGPSVTLPVGGRSIDQNVDGKIDPTEGVAAQAPRKLIQYRDGMRQTVIDLMQLVRVIQSGGMDVDGDGTSDLDGNRIYYFGISFGGMYGPILMAIDPAVRAGVPAMGGGSIIELARLGAFRGIPAAALATRVPSLSNAATLTAPTFGFNENLPLRDQPVLINEVAGALEIQDYFERWEWVGMPGDAMDYIRHLRKSPLAGVPAKPVLIQFAKGDQTVPNPAASAMIRAGGLADRATYFRNDLAVAANPILPKDPHTFLAGFAMPATVPFAIAGQTQIAMFFKSDGARTIDPDGAGTLFESPIAGPLPDELNFLR